jgi:adenine-specific DNA-methyltransferase
MDNNKSALKQLKSFLNELFQFDSQDLDFGVYKILHYKRKEIKDFIDSLLVTKVKEQLLTLTSEQSQKAMQQLKDMEQDEFIQNWINGTDEERRIGEKLSGAKIAEYRRIKTLVDEARVAEGTENHIYNHLTLFFSRYYDKGDFISKRRFGKNEKYIVPYNGEETNFYWANFDQYYIKSSETFQQYAFKIPVMWGNMVINFKLTSAQVEQGNVKADEPNFFILSEKEAEIGERETTFFFEYRPITEDEKKTLKGNNTQDVLNERAFETIQTKYNQEVKLAKLWETDAADKALLLKKLNHYTRKNKYDFFIHKNLKGFLQRELDYYIKSELIHVDDLYVTEVDSYFDRLRHNIKTIKVFKNIADTIIDFVSQIEDFQKKLWEKRKFVLSTEWVITIDRLVEYIGEKAAKPFLEEAIKNPKQVEEWKDLFGEVNVPQKLSVGALKADLHAWRKLPVDTACFSKEFKVELLNKLSQKIALDEKCDGIVLNTDNFHGIQILQDKFYKAISCIYIDPPYNAKSSEIIYKNTFKHSSWITLMENRLEIANNLLGSFDSSIVVAIDENEQENLGHILSKLFPEKEKTCVSVIHNPGGIQGNNFSYTHEYAYFLFPGEKEFISKIQRNSSNKTPLRDWGGEESKRESSRNCFYPVIVNKKFEIIGFGDVEDDSFHPNSSVVTDGNNYLIYPVDNSGVERKWRNARNTIESIYNELKCEETDGVLTIYRYKSLYRYKTVWDDKKYNANVYGSKILNDILPNKFSYPKSIYTVKDSLNAVVSKNKNSVCLDFFAGSGTTFHSNILLNKEDNGKRKCILIEQGKYVYTIIIPRIKKIAYTFDWKDGKPKNGSMNGLGIFFKYQRLEQYEEALENIAFTAGKDAQQQALKFDQYIPKYMLVFETRNSHTLVNTEAMKDPWNYCLKVWDGFTYDTETPVDLVETFNYLIGLHMHKCMTKEINGKKYQFVYGHNNSGKQILVVWRSVKDWKLEDYKDDSKILNEELKNWTYDLLYINEQAHVDGYQPIEEIFKNKMLP